MASSVVMADPYAIVVRTYAGNPQEAAALFQRDAVVMAQSGYRPIGQSYAPGSWGAGAYLFGLVAILFFGFGLLILAYLLIVKPAGKLTVTYQRG